MNRGLKYSLYAAIGLAVAGVSYSLAPYVSKQTEKTPTHIFYTEIDGIKTEKDDVLIGFSDKTLEAWVRTDKNALAPYKPTDNPAITNLESKKSKELKEAESQYQKDLKSLDEKFQGLRKKLEE